MKYSVNQIEEQTYPDSCYVVDTTRRHTLKVDETGCMSKLSMLVHQSALDLGTAVVAIALIQVKICPSFFFVLECNNLFLSS